MVRKARLILLAATLGLAGSSCSREDDTNDGSSSASPDDDDDSPFGPPDDEGSADENPAEEGGSGPEPEATASAGTSGGEPSPASLGAGESGTEPGPPVDGGASPVEGGNGEQPANGGVTDASLVMLSNPSIAIDCTNDEPLLTLSVDATYVAPDAGGPIRLEVTNIAFQSRRGSNEFSCNVLTFGTVPPMVGPLDPGTSVSVTHAVDRTACLTIPNLIDSCGACGHPAVAHLGLRVFQGDEVVDVSTLIDGAGSEEVTVSCD